MILKWNHRQMLQGTEHKYGHPALFKNYIQIIAAQCKTRIDRYLYTIINITYALLSKPNEFARFWKNNIYHPRKQSKNTNSKQYLSPTVYFADREILVGTTDGIVHNGMMLIYADPEEIGQDHGSLLSACDNFPYILSSPWVAYDSQKSVKYM